MSTEQIVEEVEIAFRAAEPQVFKRKIYELLKVISREEFHDVVVRLNKIRQKGKRGTPKNKMMLNILHDVMITHLTSPTLQTTPLT